MSMIKAVIFDMDGLLIDTEPHWQSTEKEIFKELGIEITRDMQVATFGLRCDEQIDYWYSYRPWKNVSKNEIEDRFIDRMILYYKEKAVLMKGAAEALDFFRRKGLPMALASSSNMLLIDTFLDKFGFHHYFKEVYSAEFEKHGKPHPAVYLETARRLNTHPVNCLVLEDSFHGIVAAKAARMRTIAVTEYQDKRFAASDIVLQSLTELEDEVFHQLNQLF